MVHYMVLYSYTININSSSSRGGFLILLRVSFSLEEKVFLLVGGFGVLGKGGKKRLSLSCCSAFYGYSSTYFSRINIRYGYDMNMAIILAVLLLKVHTTSPW